MTEKNNQHIEHVVSLSAKSIRITIDQLRPEEVFTKKKNHKKIPIGFHRLKKRDF